MFLIKKKGYICQKKITVENRDNFEILTAINIQKLRWPNGETKAEQK